MSERAPAITTPTFDLLMTGSLSAFVMAALLAYHFGLGGRVDFVQGDWLLFLIALNATHFMASYRLLYVSREEILGNRWSALYVPAALLAVWGLAVADVARTEIVDNLVLGSSVYLAWHYTGQAWGMVSAFSRILGVRFTDRERLAIRSGMRILLALHVLFAFSGRLPPAEWIAPATYVRAYGLVFQLVVGLAVASLLVGAWGFWSAARRGEGPITLRIVAPWLALYVWYPFWYFVPGGFIWVQLSHALQYLAFPLRVEANRFVRDRGETDARAVRRHLVLVFAGLVVAGAVTLHMPPLATLALGDGWWNTETSWNVFRGFAAIVAIHHYFVDGAIWKLSNPKVRGELFRHLD